MNIPTPVNPRKRLIILRSVSGAGKSTFANMICENIGWVVVSADDYFTDADGNYNYDFNKIGAAHKQCQDRFMEALKESAVTGIIVSNTNTKESDFKFYIEAAEKVGAQIFSIVLENRHGNENIHGVPNQTLDRHEQSIKNSLKLR